jgi:hypothetical protein
MGWASAMYAKARTLVASLFFLAAVAASLPAYASALNDFVSSLLRWFQTDSSASDTDAKARLIAKIPELNVKLLRLASTMRVYAEAVQTVASLDGRRILSPGRLASAKQNLRDLEADLQRQLIDIRRGIQEIELPLTALNLTLAINTQRVVGERQAVIVRVLNSQQLVETIAELQRVSKRTEELTQSLDEFRRKATRSEQ